MTELEHFSIFYYIQLPLWTILTDAKIILI